MNVWKWEQQAVNNVWINNCERFSMGESRHEWHKHSMRLISMFSPHSHLLPPNWSISSIKEQYCPRILASMVGTTRLFQSAQFSLLLPAGRKHPNTGCKLKAPSHHRVQNYSHKAECSPEKTLSLHQMTYLYMPYGSTVFCVFALFCSEEESNVTSCVCERQSQVFPSSLLMLLADLSGECDTLLTTQAQFYQSGLSWIPKWQKVCLKFTPHPTPTHPTRLLKHKNKALLLSLFSAAEHKNLRVILRYPGERDVYLDYHISRGSMPPSANLEFAL